jgi:hypothetical protein
MRGPQASFCFIDLTRVFFPQALQLTKARMAAMSVEVQQSLRMAELEEANDRLRVELAAADTKVAEVEHHERTLSSDYDGLHKDFDDLRTSHAAIVQEKADLEKMEHEKAQRFWNLLHKKWAELWCNTEESVAALRGRCEDFPATDATVSSLLDWFWMEVQALPTDFAECNKNITYFMLVGVFKMLAGLSAILHDVPDDLGRIAKKLMRN